MMSDALRVDIRVAHAALAVLLAAGLAQAPAVQAAGPIVAGKARAKLAQQSKRLASQTPRPAAVVSQGLALALSTELRVMPTRPAVPPVVAKNTLVPAVPTQPGFVVPVWTGNPRFASGAENPYLPRPVPTVGSQIFGPIQAAPDLGTPMPPVDLSRVFGGLGAGIPLLPESGRSILPTVKKVYPTGEKPLVVVSFKCPTEVIGVTPPTIKLLHDMVDLGMEGLNRTDLLSFNLQQVCQ